MVIMLKTKSDMYTFGYNKSFKSFNFKMFVLFLLIFNPF